MIDARFLTPGHRLCPGDPLPLPDLVLGPDRITGRLRPVPLQVPQSHPVVFENELAAWVSAQLGLPCRPNYLPEKDTRYPLLSFSTIDGEPTMRLSGPAGNGWKLVQFDCWSLDAGSAAVLAYRLFQLLAGFSGRMGDATVQAVNPGRSQTSAERAFEGNGGWVHRQLAEYQFWHVLPIPVR